MPTDIKDLPADNRGQHGKKLDVERYPNGRIKYKQDLKKKYESAKQRQKLIGVQIPISLAEEFESKLTLEGTSKNAKLRSWIEGYIYNDNPK